MKTVLKKALRSRRSSNVDIIRNARSGIRGTRVTIDVKTLSLPTQSFRIAHMEIVKDLETYNPTLKSVLKVEDLFQNSGEFDSRTQLLRKLDGSMKIQVLNVILKYLKSLGKVLDNPDGSWTWIFSKNNETLKKSWEKADKL